MPEIYEFAEPENGGGFTPRHGDYGRSMALLKTAAAWYDGKVIPPADEETDPECREL